MVFTNLIMTTRVGRTANQPPMSSITTRGYKSTNFINPRGGYQKPCIVTTIIHNHKNGHFVKPNKVAVKYLDFKKDANLDAHVRVFNFAMKANAEIFEIYIINVFIYMLRYTTSNLCHN